MALGITAAFRKLLQKGEVATNAKLNQMLDIVFSLTGTVDTAQLTANAVTTAQASGGAWFWGTDAGTANAHVVTTAQALAAHVTGEVIAYKALAGPNTGAVTLTVNGLAVHTIKNASGSDLVAGDIIAGQVVEVRFDGTNFQLISDVANNPNVTNSNINAASRLYLWQNCR